MPQHNHDLVLNLQKRIQALENQKQIDNKTLDTLRKDNQDLKRKIENLTNQLVASDSAYRSMAAKLDEILVKPKKKQNDNTSESIDIIDNS